MARKENNLMTISRLIFITDFYFNVSFQLHSQYTTYGPLQNPQLGLITFNMELESLFQQPNLYLKFRLYIIHWQMFPDFKKIIIKF